MTYDELNDMIENPRSEPFDDYFGDMEISESEKKKRITLAEKLKENFLPILFFLFTYQKYGLSIDWEESRLQFEIAYKNTLKEVMTIDSYLDNYIKIFSYDVIDSTKRHEDDFYYYSEDRVTLISESESHTDWNYDEFQTAIQSGKTMKKWVDVRDKRERETHRKVGGTIKPIKDVFLVGNSIMNFPKDSSFGASAKEICGCRCTIKYF